MVKAVEHRFWSKVTKGSDSDCWLWNAGKSTGSTGMTYGVFWLDGRMRQAHRVAYTLAVGPVPEGMTIDHLCRVTLCVNPAHLEAVTSAANVLRGQGQPAVNARKTVCLRGHELSGDNLRIRKADEARICRICAAARRRRVYEKYRY